MVMLADLITNLLNKDASKWQYTCPGSAVLVYLLAGSSFMESGLGREIDFLPVTLVLMSMKQSCECDCVT